MRSCGWHGPSPSSRTAYLVIVQIILVQGFLLLLLGANTGNSYVDWAYRSLDRVMAPFRGIFQSVDLSGNSVLDTSVIFAMVMYGILALVVHSLLDWLTYRLQRLEERRLRDEARAAAAAALQAAAYGVPDPAVPGSPAYGRAPAYGQAPAPAPAHGAAPTGVQPQASAPAYPDEGPGQAAPPSDWPR